MPDVRAAYRLLYFYQDRVLGTVKYITERLGLRYEGGWSKFSDVTPRDGKGSLDKWSWDWLNMYHYEFHLGERKVQGQRIAISVLVQSDTGFYDRPDAKKTKPATFAPVGESATRLQFMIGRNLWHTDVAEKFSKTMTSTCDDYVIITGETEGKAGIMIVKSFPLEDFADEMAIWERLTELMSYCNANGVPELALASPSGL